MSTRIVPGLSGRGPIERTDGFALITSLLMLVVVTLLAVGMFRNLTLQEKIAGNTMEKQRSLAAAESALQFGEWMLQHQATASSGIPPAANCAAGAVYDANSYTTNQTLTLTPCVNALPNPTALPWGARGDYLPPNMTVASGGGVVASNAANGNPGDINYYAEPSVYVSYLGPDADGTSPLYQVTGAGYGGSANTVSVVRSTVKVSYGGGVKSLDGE
jgi:type IV pilus assembly protein PilX